MQSSESKCVLHPAGDGVGQTGTSVEDCDQNFDQDLNRRGGQVQTPRSNTFYTTDNS